MSSAGRYLSPEPMLQSPAYMTTTASRGMQVPTYAYAANNPLRYTDPTGLAIGEGLAQCYSDCVRETVSPAQVACGAAGAAASIPGAEAAAVGAAYDIGVFLGMGSRARAAAIAFGLIEANSTAFSVARASGAAAAFTAVGAEAACLISCRNNWAPQYINRTNGESVESQLDAPWWRFW